MDIKAAKMVKNAKWLNGLTFFYVMSEGIMHRYYWQLLGVKV